MWHSSILSTLHRFQKEGLYCDVTLQSTDDVSISVHACILGAVCPEIHTHMSSKGPHTGSVIEIPVLGSELEDLVSLIYSGSLTVDLQGMSEGFRGLITQLDIQIPIKEEKGMESEEGSLVDPDEVARLAPTENSPGSSGSPAEVPSDEKETKYQTKAKPRKVPVIKDDPENAEMDEKDGLDSDGVAPASPNISLDDDDDEATDLQEDDSQNKDASKKKKLRLRKKVKSQNKSKGKQREEQPITKRRGRPKKTAQTEDTQNSEHTEKPKTKPKTKPKVPRPKPTPKSLTCSYCAKQFRKSWHRLRHERTHTGARPYKCKYCDKTFTRAAHCRRHENVHTGDIIYMCKHCGKEFKHHSQFSSHEKSHTQQNKYQCQYCHKRFTWKQSLEAHERAHRGEIIHQCSICHKSFTAASVLKDHEKAHRGEKEFQCSYCPARFVRRYGVVVHERTHTGEKPFSCRLCNKKFRTQSARTEHERIHASASETGEVELPGGRTIRPKVKKPKKQECSFCGKLFLKNCQRMVHERSHTGEKPFPCSICGKCFADVTHRRRHEKLHSDLMTSKSKARTVDLTQRDLLATEAAVHVLQSQEYVAVEAVQQPILVAWPTAGAVQPLEHIQVQY